MRVVFVSLFISNGRLSCYSTVFFSLYHGLLILIDHPSVFLRILLFYCHSFFNLIECYFSKKESTDLHQPSRPISHNHDLSLLWNELCFSFYCSIYYLSVTDCSIIQRSVINKNIFFFLKETRTLCKNL